MTIATTIILGFLSFSDPTYTQVPDLCDVVNPETGTPTICQVHGPDAPVLDQNVCCNGSECALQTGTSCAANEKLYHCDYGKANEYGDAICFFEVPDYCDVYECESGGTGGYSAGPQAEYLCCWFGECYEWPPDMLSECGLNNIFWCQSPYQNPDGTVGCADNE